jgi:pectinesterase
VDYDGREQVVISSKRRYITVEGERPYNHGSGLRTIIEYNATAGDLDNKGLPLGTFRSATFAVDAKNFIARYITIKV